VATALLLTAGDVRLVTSHAFENKGHREEVLGLERDGVQAHEKVLFMHSLDIEYLSTHYFKSSSINPHILHWPIFLNIKKDFVKHIF
jgi:hypothetical protein